jgi:hypothetical protein
VSTHVEYTVIHTVKALLLVTHSCSHASSGSGLRKRRAHRSGISILASDMRLFPFLRVHTELGGLWSVENETDILSISTQRSRACRERASAGSGVLIDQASVLASDMRLFPFLRVHITELGGLWSVENETDILSISTQRSCL